MKKFMRNLLLLISGILLFTVLGPAGLSVQASEFQSEKEPFIYIPEEETILTAAQLEKAEIIEEEVNRLLSLPEEQRNLEIQQTFEEAEGTEFYFGEQSTATGIGMFSRAAQKTNAKIVNGGMNFFAYNWEGADRMANDFKYASIGTGTVAAIVKKILPYAPSLSAKVISAFIGGFAAYATVRFAQAAIIMRKVEQTVKNKAKSKVQGGARITAIEVLNITGRGINAYAK